MTRHTDDDEGVPRGPVKELPACSLERRSFLTYAGAAMASALLPELATGCGPGASGDARPDDVAVARAMLTLSNSAMTLKLAGPQPWAVILCYTSDRVAPFWPPIDYFTDLVTVGKGGLADYWSAVSHGCIDLTGSQVFGWVQLGTNEGDTGALRRDQLVAAAQAAATAQGIDLSPFSHTLAVCTNYSSSGNVGSDVALSVGDPSGQPGWRWCQKCQALAYWDGSAPPGPCAGGGIHDHSASAYYAAPTNDFYGSQEGWCWCSKCMAMVYSTSSPAACPAGGQHDLSQSEPYYISLDGPSTSSAQDGWRWCSKCQGLAYGSSPPGACSAGGLHDHSSSGEYSVPWCWSADIGFLAHETGHGFNLDHAFGTSRSGDIENDTRPGAYGDWTDVMSWANAASSVGATFTPVGPGLSGPMIRKLGWIPSSNVARYATGAGTQTQTLSPLYGGVFAGAPSGIVLLQVERPEEGRIYTAEYRVQNLTNGVIFDRGLGHPRVVVHMLQSLYLAGQDSWRYCSACDGLVFAGQTPCPAGGTHDGSSSMDYGLLHDVGSSGGQDQWSWCSKCSGLVYAGNSTPSPCAGGGFHDLSQSYDYDLLTFGGGQSGWGWCRKCQALGFAGGPEPGPCPATGRHDYSASANYVLGTGGGDSIQNKWRWCKKCQGLYFAGLGACAGNDVHQLFASSDYSITNGYDAGGAQSGWKYCSKCYSLAYGSNPPGPCAAGGTHDQSGSWSYSLQTDAEAAAGQVRWFICKKCSVFNYVDPSRGAGLCAAGGNHDSTAEHLVAHDTSSVPGQQGFRWCKKCETMVSGDNPSGCPAGGNHDTGGSANYVIRTDPSTRVRESSFIRTCSKCSALMALQNGSQKPCAAGGVHTPQGEFFLTQRNSDPFWRWCSKCQVVAFWDGSSSPGPCPAGGQHDHSQSYFYRPPHIRGEVTEVLQSDLQPGQSFTSPSGTTVFQVVSFDSSGATIQVTA